MMITKQPLPSIPPFLAGDSSKELLKDLYTTMLKIRLVEEKIADLIEKKKIVCPCHLYIGQESVATGVCKSLAKKDYVFSTHRSHGHYLAKGGDLKAMMAELFGRSTGCSAGHGGSMHLVDPEIGFPGSSAIVGGSIPLAIGTALAAYIEGSDKVTVSFFGDGAATEGVFYESLNYAALEKLPVIFVCENNLYSTHMHISTIQASTDICKRAEAFHIPSVKIDGNNVLEVLDAAQAAIDRARSGGGPTFIECMTYRWRGHVGPKWDVDKGLRPQEEVDLWMEKCPIKRIDNLLMDTGIISSVEREEIREGIALEIEESLRFAQESPFPEPAEYHKLLFKYS